MRTVLLVQFVEIMNVPTLVIRAKECVLEGFALETNVKLIWIVLLVLSVKEADVILKSIRKSVLLMVIAEAMKCVTMATVLSIDVSTVFIVLMEQSVLMENVKDTFTKNVIMIGTALAVTNVLMANVNNSILALEGLALKDMNVMLTMYVKELDQSVLSTKIVLLDKSALVVVALSLKNQISFVMVQYNALLDTLV